MMERVSLYERRYYHEIERREELNRRVSLPMGIIVLLLGTLPSYFIPTVSRMETAGERAVLIFLTGGMTGALITATVYLIKTYLWKRITGRESYNYAEVPLPDEIEEYLESTGNGEVFRELMIENYAAATRINFGQNNIKEYFLYKAVEWLIYALCIGGAALVFINCRIVQL